MTAGASSGVSAVTLSDFDGNRHNNFTTIRIVLAWSVLYGHSFAIAKKPGVADPLRELFQGSAWIGELAVNGFFAISGFLVAASFCRRGFVDYSVSRALRIYPALAACVFLSVLLLGPALTSLSLADYFSSPETYRYLRNALAFIPMEWGLPGMFESNVRAAVNGSLWTLTVEVYCYTLLAAVGLLGLLQHKVLANAALLAVFLFGMFHFAELPLVGYNDRWQRPAAYFLLGVFVYVNRHHLVLDRRLAAFSGLLAVASFGEDWFTFVFPPAFVYLIFYLAYATPFLNTDGTVGDVSYGVYIYAWPVQQAVAAAFPAQGAYFNMALSTCLVFAMAYASWHLIEKRALAMKSRLLRRREREAAVS